MACDFQGGISLHFQRTGVVLRAYEITIREKRNRLSEARVKISRDGATVIRERLSDIGASKDAVIIEIGGVEEGRYLYDLRHVRLSQGDEQAWVTLLDPLKVLQGDEITRIYDRSVASDVINDILDLSTDESSAITGFELFDSDSMTSNSRRRAITSWATGYDDRETLRQQREDSDSIRSRFFKASETALYWMLEAVAYVLPMNTDSLEGGFSFDETDLMSALFAVCNEFGMIPWVKTDGTLIIGLPELVPSQLHSIHGIPKRDGLVLQEYNVTSGSAPVASVSARGTSRGYQNEENSVVNLYPKAKAWVPGFEGESVSIEDPLKIRSQAAVEQYVRSTLLSYYADHTNGNIIFNGVSSPDNETLVKMRIGDTVLVSPQIERHCADNVEGGFFIINEVRHDINTRVGWQITASVAGLPGEIESSSELHDRASERSFDDIDDFVGANL